MALLAPCGQGGRRGITGRAALLMRWGPKRDLHRTAGGQRLPHVCLGCTAQRRRQRYVKFDPFLRRRVFLPRILIPKPSTNDASR